jgi:hypothetical protein
MATQAAAPPAHALRAHAADFRSALLRQLSNEFVGGSLALAAASALLSLALWSARWAASAAADALFTRFDFPPGTPQCLAAARWLQAQPSMRRAGRRVVIDARAARLAALQSSSGAPFARKYARTLATHLRARC